MPPVPSRPGQCRAIVADARVDRHPRRDVARALAGGRARDDTAAAALAIVALVAAQISAIVGVGVAVGALIMLDSLNTTALQQATSDGLMGRAIGVMYSLSAVWMTVGALSKPALVAAVGP